MFSQDGPEFEIFGLLTLEASFLGLSNENFCSLSMSICPTRGAREREEDLSYSSSLFGQNGTKEQKFNNEKDSGPFFMRLTQLSTKTVSSSEISRANKT